MFHFKVPEDHRHQKTCTGNTEIIAIFLGWGSEKWSVVDIKEAESKVLRGYKGMKYNGVLLYFALLCFIPDPTQPCLCSPLFPWLQHSIYIIPKPRTPERNPDHILPTTKHRDIIGVYEDPQKHKSQLSRIVFQ